MSTIRVHVYGLDEAAAREEAVKEFGTIPGCDRYYIIDMTAEPVDEDVRGYEWIVVVRSEKKAAKAA